jgi:enoyl-CoA hydratase/carnithine racemase
VPSRRPKPDRIERTAPRPRRRGSNDGTIEIRREAGCVTVVLTRPAARNRISAAMARALIELAEQVEDDDSIKLLAITGATGSFCAGFDDDVDPSLVESLAILAKPTLAILNGDAIDEGLELALVLDIRIAEAGAQLGLTQLKRGALPRFGGTQRLPRLVGGAQALRMLLTGAMVDGAEALRIGMVSYLARGSRGVAEVAASVTGALLSRGPVAARLVKEAVLKGYDMTLEQGIRLEEDLYALLQTTADRAEGVRAFLEKRKPLFKGV